MRYKCEKRVLAHRAPIISSESSIRSCSRLRAEQHLLLETRAEQYILLGSKPSSGTCSSRAGPPLARRSARLACGQPWPGIYSSGNGGRTGQRYHHLHSLNLTCQGGAVESASSSPPGSM